MYKRQEQNHDVTVIEFRDTVGADVIHEHRVYLMKDFEDYKIKEITGAKVCKFYEDGVEYETADGQRPVSYTHLAYDREKEVLLKKGETVTCKIEIPQKVSAPVLKRCV